MTDDGKTVTLTPAEYADLLAQARQQPAGGVTDLPWTGPREVYVLSQEQRCPAP